MSTSSEKRLLEAARRCDGAAIEEIVAGGKTNLDAVDQVGSNFRDFILIDAILMCKCKFIRAAFCKSRKQCY